MLTTAGKQRVAQSMYAKGKAFIVAGLLLDKRARSEADVYVVLHLLCHGVENALKGLLLLKNHDRYRAKLKRPIGHDLEALAATATSEFGLKPVLAPLAAELRTLSQLYKGHWLRYGTGHDILVDPRTVATRLLLQRLAAAFRLADRQLAPPSPAT